MGWYSPNYKKRQKFAITNTSVIEGATDAIVELYITEDFDLIYTDGKDIVVTAEDGVSIIPFKVISYDTVTKTCIVSVLLDSIAPGETKYVYVYYNGPIFEGSYNVAYAEEHKFDTERMVYHAIKDVVRAQNPDNFADWILEGTDYNLATYVFNYRVTDNFCILFRIRKTWQSVMVYLNRTGGVDYHPNVSYYSVFWAKNFASDITYKIGNYYEAYYGGPTKPPPTISEIETGRNNLEIFNKWFHRKVSLYKGIWKDTADIDGNGSFSTAVTGDISPFEFPTDPYLSIKLFAWNKVDDIFIRNANVLDTYGLVSKVVTENYKHIPTIAFTAKESTKPNTIVLKLEPEQSQFENFPYITGYTYEIYRKPMEYPVYYEDNPSVIYGEFILSGDVTKDAVIFEDANLEDNRFYYYMLFVKDDEDYLHEIGKDFALSCKDYNYINKIKKITPSFWWREDTTGDLEDFFKLISSILNTTHAYIDAYDFVELPDTDIVHFLESFGYDSNVIIDKHYALNLLAKFKELVDLRGTALSITGFIKAVTDWESKAVTNRILYFMEENEFNPSTLAVTGAYVDGTYVTGSALAELKFTGSDPFFYTIKEQSLYGVGLMLNNYQQYDIIVYVKPIKNDRYMKMKKGIIETYIREFIPYISRVFVIYE